MNGPRAVHGRPGDRDRLPLPLFDGGAKAEGLIGITICKQVFSNRLAVEERAKRITCTLPLDKSEASEATG